MAPVNGVAGTPAITSTRPPNRAIVPVLPLNYPQRPANKQVSAAAVPAPATNGQNGVRPAPEKTTESRGPKQDQELPNGKSTGRGPSSANKLGAATPSAASIVQTVAKAERPGSVAAPDECEKGMAALVGAVTPLASLRLPRPLYPHRPSASFCRPGLQPLAQEHMLTNSIAATPTVSSALPDRRIGSPARHRPPGLSYPAPEAMGASGLIPEGPVTAPHPAMMNRPAFHHPHPSNGSFIFAGFDDSNASSPAPLAGGFPPPPRGLHPYPPPGIDGYGRPLLVSPAVDGFASSLVNPHGPPTPHSFHGSQSSAHAEEQGFGHYAPVNGHAGHPAAAPAGQVLMPPPGMNGPMNDTVHPASSSVSAYQTFRDQDEALSFLRHGVSDNTFNDCMLEVRFPDSPEFQDHPGYRQILPVLRTHGHRFVFSRSPMLASAMKAQGTVPGGVIFLEANDEYMRSDIFWYSLRTLYGWSLADGILPTELPLRDVKDDLKTTLGYLATARYLQLPWVHSVAIHRASRLVFWNTIEVAVKFVSQIVAMALRNDGFGVAEFLEQVLSFIVHNFPADFVLDLNAGDGGFPRLPPSSPAPRNPNAPTIANGTSSGPHSRQPSKTQAQMPRNPRVSSNPRLSQIKLSQIQFGDISPSKGGQAPRTLTTNDTVLSRILLNLPFELLKQILEHPHLAKSSGELGPSDRQSMIADIVAERESRRLRALEKADPLLRVYQDRVEAATGPLVVGHMDDFWTNNMGFKEEVFPGDLPYLVHTWSPAASSGASA